MSPRLKRKHIVLGIIGGLLYVFLELLWRQHSHWTMFLLGGICFLVLGGINEILPWETPIWKQMVVGVSIITVLEFLTGCIVNLWLGWNVWDYSELPGNILGQVCLPYFILWIPVSLIGIVLDDWLRYRWWGEERPRYKFFDGR